MIIGERQQGSNAIFLVAIVAVALSGACSPKRTADMVQVGATKSDVLKEFGQPARWVTTDMRSLRTTETLAITGDFVGIERDMPENELWVFEYVVSGKKYLIRLRSGAVTGVSPGDGQQ